MKICIPPPLPSSPNSLLHRGIHHALLLLQGAYHFTKTPLSDSLISKTQRALQLHRLCKKLLRQLGVEVRVHGQIPTHGLIITNHVSFLDILLLSSIAPTTFVAKSEVAQWPIIGSIAANAGTLFIKRQSRTDVARLNIQVSEALQSGHSITLFPEGTTTDGLSILPFQPSLLQPAIDLASPVTPGFLTYTTPEGTYAEDLAYYGDRPLSQCLFALLARRHTIATVSFGAAITPSSHRKEFATELHNAVQNLRKDLLTK